MRFKWTGMAGFTPPSNEIKSTAAIVEQLMELLPVEGD